MANPFRSRMMDALKVDGPSTASALATRTGQAVGSASHHLKVLHEAGLVEEAPELAKDRRERWWRLVDAGTRWSRPTSPTTLPRSTAAYAAEALALQRQFERTQEWNANAVVRTRVGRRRVRHPELDAAVPGRAHRRRRRDRRRAPALVEPTGARRRRRTRVRVRLRARVPGPAMTTHTAPVAPPPPLARNRNFALLWFGEGVSVLGNATTSVLLPLLAVVGFDAGAGWMGAAHRRGLGALAAHRAAGRRLGRPPARPPGHDRQRPRRRASPSPACRSRGCSTSSRSPTSPSPRSATACAPSFFRAAYPALVRQVARASSRSQAFARLFGTESAMQVAGPGVGGLLAQAISAAGGLLVDARQLPRLGGLPVAAQAPGCRAAPDGRRRGRLTGPAHP